VAHSLSAKKRVRQNLKHRARNRARKDALKDQIRTLTAAFTAGDMTKAEQELRNTTSRLDRLAAKGTMHKNTAARKRSRLARQLNALKAAGPKPAAPEKGAKKKAPTRAKKSAAAAPEQA
jgi:small subunit ribosomal protein S20